MTEINKRNESRAISRTTLQRLRDGCVNQLCDEAYYRSANRRQVAENSLHVCPTVTPRYVQDVFNHSINQFTVYPVKNETLNILQ